MIAEKLSTFAIYGTDNTRDKDLFDAYWLITRIQHDKTYAKALGGSRKNWTGGGATKIIDAVVAYLEEL